MIKTQIESYNKGYITLLSLWLIVASFGEFIYKPITFGIILVVSVYFIYKRNKYIKYLLVTYILIGLIGIIVISLNKAESILEGIGMIAVWLIGLMLLYKSWCSFK